MGTYIVRIGDELYKVQANDHQTAKYKAAEEFKEKHNLKVSITDIVSIGLSSRSIPSPPEVTISTQSLLKKLEENETSRTRTT